MVTSSFPDRDVDVVLRADLSGLPVYRAGRPAVAPAGLAPYKLSSNENPYSPLIGVREALFEASDELNRYPDPGATELVAALSRRWDVPGDHIATGTGSVGVCQQIISACAGPGDEVIYAWRSFEAYPLIVTIAGATSVQVALTTDERHDLDAIAAAVTPRTRVILICTPNNPTGTVVNHADLEDLLGRIPAHIVVVIDEAYVEFVRDRAAADGLALYRAHPNVVVLRTFSKAYGLAGLRVGFAIAHPVVAEITRRVGMPFAVSSLGQAAAVASLKSEPELLDRVERIVEERDRMNCELLRQGHPVVESQGNFVWLRLAERSLEFTQVCTSHGLSVRAFEGEGVRITAGEKEANDRLLSLTADFAPP